MIFSDFYKGRSPLAKLRHHQAIPVPVKGSPDWSGQECADLLSRDKVKVKEAVKRYLASKVRNDWEFNWPKPTTPPAADEPPLTLAQPDDSHDPKSPLPSGGVQDETKDDDGYQVDAESEVEDNDESHLFDSNNNSNDNDNASIYSIISEDPRQFKSRLDWDSDAPADEPLSPCAVEFGDSELNLSTLEKRAKHRRELRKEMEYNEGLACFEARRNAWTEARTVRLRIKPQTPPAASVQRSPRRFFFRRSISGSPTTTISQTLHSPSASAASAGSSEASGPDTANPTEKDTHKQQQQHQRVSQDKDSNSGASDHDQSQPAYPRDDPSLIASYPVETIVPVPQPILPPANPLRASIQPSAYLQLYDKLIINNLQPSCPINLSDMIGACVAGWKRDGEWPPRPALPVDPTFAPVKVPSGGSAARRKRNSVATNNESGGTSPTARRKSFTGLLTRDRDGEARGGKSMRHSLSRALGLGSPFSPHMELGAAADRG